jgi:hypothetical protein
MPSLVGAIWRQMAATSFAVHGLSPRPHSPCRWRAARTRYQNPTPGVVRQHGVSLAVQIAERMLPASWDACLALKLPVISNGPEKLGA